MDRPALPEQSTEKALSWHVGLELVDGTLVATIDGDFSADEDWEFAFYLMNGRTRCATHWYTAEPRAHFAKPQGAGRYHSTGFARRRGSKEGFMKHSAPLELGVSASVPAVPAVARLTEPTSERVVMVKSYYGLGGDLCVLLCAMRYARDTGREVLVDWSNGLYGQASGGDLFRQLFDAPRFDGVERVRGRSLSVYPPYWADRVELLPMTYVTGVPLTMSRAEDVPAGCTAACVVITRDSREVRDAPHIYHEFAARLRPIARIRDAVERQIGRLAGARHSIGVHYRHGNGERTVIAPDPEWFRSRIDERIAGLGLAAADVAVYVATDCGAAMEHFRRRYPLTVDLGKQYRAPGAGPMHSGRHDLDAAAKRALAEEALVDMLVLSRCDSFVGSLGYFSIFVRTLRAGGHGVVYDGPRVFGDAQRPLHWTPATADPVVGPALAAAALPTDGLFVELEDGLRKVRYYDAPLGFAGGERLDATAFDALRRAIVARRLY